MESIDNLLAARLCLKANLEQSKALATAIDKTGLKLDQINKRLPIFDDLSAKRCTLVSVKEQIDRSVGLSVAVLKVFRAVRGHESLVLSDPRSDLYSYLSNVKRLDEALKFLASNCTVAVDWLHDTIKFLDQNQVTDDAYISNMKRSMKILKESNNFDGGLLDIAFDKLENEFNRLLVENSWPFHMAASSSYIDDQQPCIVASPLPVSVVQKLQAIVRRLQSEKTRLQKCMLIYVNIRGANAKASLEALDLDYFKVKITEFNSLMSKETHIDRWCKHLDFAVKHLFDHEHKLCNDVFESIEPYTKTECFSNIVTQAGFLRLLEFGNNVTRSKKGPIKLLKLLEVFSVLNKLRPNFNALFGGKPCIQIQTQMRKLVKKIVDESCNIFSQLALQVESQRRSSPPSDGTVQKQVSFLTEYCEELLDERYSTILSHVLLIHHNWQHKEYKEKLLTNEILNIMDVLDLNIEKWSKSYEDPLLSYIFRINNHYYLYQNLNNTKLGELMGEFRVKQHENYIEYYVTTYLRESWDTLRSLLNKEDTNMVSAGTATTRELVKNRLNTFNEAFDGMFKKHSNWVITDKGLRKKICNLAMLTVLPAYRNYMKTYGHLIENDPNVGKFVIYTEERLMKMLSSLYKVKIGKYGSTKNSYLIDRIKNAVTNQLCLTICVA